MGNAVLSLYSILCSGNYCSTADVLIFPIMFDLWLGVELWLKSCVDAIYYILGMDNEVKKNHKIYEYLEVLEKELINQIVLKLKIHMCYHIQTLISKL